MEKINYTDLQKTLERRVPYSSLRSQKTQPYRESEVCTILSDPRFVEGYRVKKMLNELGIGLHSPDRFLGGKALYKTRNMTLGYVGNPYDSTDNIGVTGFCFSRFPSVESMYPLLLLDEMLEEGAVNTVVIAFPKFIYNIRGYHTIDQYRNSLLVAAGIFKDKIGKNVVLMPDDTVFLPKTLATFLISPHVGIEPTQIKYERIHKRPTYYDYIRGPFSAADVLLAGEALGKNTTVVADTLDNEIIHSTFHGSRIFGKKSNVVMITTLPRLDGKPAVNSYEVSSQEEVLSPLEPEEIKRKVKTAHKVLNIPEVCPVFNNLFPLLDREISEKAYLDYSFESLPMMSSEAERKLSEILYEGKRIIDMYSGSDKMINHSLDLLNLESTTKKLEEQVKLNAR